MNFLKVDRSLYSQKCSLVQITDTVDATETVLYATLNAAPFPIGKEHMERSFHHTPDIGMGMPAGAMLFISKPAATPPHRPCG